MQYREVNSDGYGQLCDQERLNLSGHIGEEFADVAQKVLRLLKLHKVPHHHLDALRVEDLLS
jgi:hypothetical protein